MYVNPLNIIKIGIFLILLLISLIIFHVVVGFLGIQYYFGSIVAIILTIICIMFKFPLPLSFATFFGITNVLEWHWIIALIISSPGLLFLTPKRTKSTFKATFHNAGYFYNFSGKKSDNLKHTIKKHVRNNDIIDGDYKVLKEKQDE